MVEGILKNMESAYGIRSCCLRYFNAAGGDPDEEVKNFKKKESNLIPVILRSLKKGDHSMTIFGTDYPTPDGTCVRDYIHILDLGQAHIQAMEQLFEGKPSCCYNLGNGQGFSVKEVIEASEKGLPALSVKMEVNTVSPEELQKFADMAQPAVRKLIDEKLGSEGTAMLDAMLSSIQAAQ